MPRSALIAATLLAGLCTACGITFSSSLDGTNVSRRNGQVFVDDVHVAHQRELTVRAHLDGSQSLRLTSHSRPIDVVGELDDEIELFVTVWSEHPDDGEVEFVDGKLRVHSALGGKVLIDGVRGRIPASAPLSVANGVGEIVVTGMESQASLEVGSGTGSIELVGCAVDRLRINTGTGDIDLSRCQARSLDINSGTGDVRATDCVFEQLDAASGTGSFDFDGGSIGQASFDSGTGDVRGRGTHIASVKHSLGTGTYWMKDARDG